MILSGGGIFNQTATAGTRIQVALGGLLRTSITHVSNVNYKAGTTPHTGTLMRAASRSTVVGAVAAAGTSITSAAKLTDGAGNDIAANDVLCVLLDNGTWFVTTVSSLDATKTIITTSTAVPAGRSIAAGARIVAYGFATDAYHASYVLPALTASTAVNVPAVPVLSLCAAPTHAEPIVLDVDNITAAGTLNYANWVYSDN